MKRWITGIAVMALIGVRLAEASVNIEMVTVGNPGNAADTRYATPGFGAVGYIYNIGKYEVTAGQYTTFLNAVASTDTYGLYKTMMQSDAYGCQIKRSGTSGSYTYSVASDYANRPVNDVSFWDAARFTNWLHNGQPTGSQNANTTEDGAYTLTATGMANNTMTRNAGWLWAVTSEDEWYKAAYYDPEKPGGSGYWDYATGTDSVPGRDTSEATNPGNNANYRLLISRPYLRSTVGEFELSDSPYGTFDQAGNVWEWNDAIVDSARGLRGGALCNDESLLAASYRYTVIVPTHYDIFTGFRVVSSEAIVSVPEPCSLAVWALGTVGIAGGWLRRRGTG